MIAVPGNKIVFCDCDDTLVFWSPTEEQRRDNGTVSFTCPGSIVWDVDGDEIGYAGEWTEELVPNWPQIEQLKKFKIRGHTIVVWSAAGVEWCETIVKTLNMSDFVDVVICKPTYIFDDLPCDEFMPKSRLITKDSK